MRYSEQIGCTQSQSRNEISLNIHTEHFKTPQFALLYFFYFKAQDFFNESLFESSKSVVISGSVL